MQSKRLIRRPEVEKQTGLSRSTIYSLMEKGIFPRPVRIGRGAVGWIEAEIQQYIDECILAGRLGSNPK